MKEVDQAIVSQFATSSTLLSRYGAMRYAEQTSRVRPPFAVFFKVTSTPKEAISGRYIEDMMYQISLFDTDKAQLDDSLNTLFSTFDRCRPTVSNAPTGSVYWVSCNRFENRVLVTGDRPDTNDRVYHGVVRYAIRVDRSF